LITTRGCGEMFTHLGFYLFIMHILGVLFTSMLCFSNLFPVREIVFHKILKDGKFSRGLFVDDGFFVLWICRRAERQIHGSQEGRRMGRHEHNSGSFVVLGA
jgi:hypothetical protein